MSARIMKIVLWLLFAVAASAQAQTVEYLHTDALGSVVAVTNASRTVLERREYEPYGAQLTPAVTNGPGYTGHVQDAATGLVYMQQRYYDAQIGRFLSVDPIVADAATGSGFNRYVYGNSNPFKFTDPDGRSALTLGRIVATVSYKTATKLGAAALGSYLGLALYDVLHQEEEATSDEPSSAPEPGTPDSDMGCIYRCDGVSEGQETPSGKPYVGSADDKKKRAQTARDGRDRENAETIGEYKKGDRKGRQEAEQKGMNENGGKDNLDNKRNEVREDKWKDRDIPPPKKL